MRYIKNFVALFFCFVIFLLPSCKGVESDATLKIAVNGIQGEFNPFYAQSQADRLIIDQMYRTIQYTDRYNKSVNYCGGISYEFVGDNQIKYTVSIDDNLYFSDGTNITIDDVIFFYHFIADASYDGVYSDFYLNDIVGIKEYYFDDNDYESAIEDIEWEISNNYTISTITQENYVDYLVDTKLEGKFNGNLDSDSPYGKTWREHLLKFGYSQAISDLGANPSEKSVLKLVAQVEAENNKYAYNPENGYREILYNEYLDSSYTDSSTVNSISGIKKVNDYTCTVLFDSKNINAASELNALLLSKDYFAVDYVKGSADTIKSMAGETVVSGAYILEKYEDDTLLMNFNAYYSDECDFTRLQFTDYPADTDFTKLVTSGKADIIMETASSQVVDKLNDEDVRYFITDCDYYVSLFLNSKTLSLSARKALIGLCDVTSEIDNIIGSYYTKLLRPISIRFDEYPNEITSAFYSESAFTVYNMSNTEKIKDLNAYYCGAEGELAHSVLLYYKDLLTEKGINLNVIVTDETTFENAVISGKADLWVEKVYDGPSCDKFDYYNTNGKMNKTGISNPEIDSLTSSIRSGVGYYDRSEMTAQLMELVMEQAVECPLYQPQTITVYNTDTISEESLKSIGNIDGFTYYIPLLKKN